MVILKQRKEKPNNETNNDIPAQLPIVASPVHPSLHWHVNDPAVFEQSAFESLLEVALVHSSISE